MCKYIYYIYTHAHMHDYSFLCPEWLIPQFGMIYMFLGVRVLGWYHGPWVIFFGIGSLVIIGDRFFLVLYVLPLIIGAAIVINMCSTIIGICFFVGNIAY